MSSRKRQILYGIVWGFAIIGMLTTALFIITRTKDFVVTLQAPLVVYEPPEIDEQLIPVNEYSRPGIALKKIKGIVVHYTANPGTSAQQNHDYFSGLAQSHLTKVSCHYIIGLDGEIIQCVPDEEQAYASNERNKDTLSIECCHFDQSGEFYVQTYESLVHLTAYLIGKYGLSTDDVIRHYDVTGKSCPKYFVDHPKEWDKFKEDINKYIKLHGTRGKKDEKKKKKHL